jgi:hypothetical protein
MIQNDSYGRARDGRGLRQVKIKVDHGVKLLEMDPVDKFRVLDYAYNYWLENKVTDFNDPEDSELIG